MRRLSILALALFACDSEPAEHIVAKQTHLIQYQSCSQLESDLKAMLVREVSAEIDRWDRSKGLDDSAPTAGESGDQSGGRQEGVDFSGTNNQETGVDEADGVKTDGYHIYALNGHQLHIFAVPQFGQLVPVSATNVEGHPRQMLVDKDSNRVVVFSLVDVGRLPEGHPLREAVGYKENDNQWYWRSQLVSKATVFDMTDRANLKLVREVWFEGWYQTARKVDSTVRVSSYASIDRRELWDYWELVEAVGKMQAKAIVADRIHNLSLKDLTPQMYVRTPDGAFRTEGLTNSACRGYYRPYDSHARGFSSLISFDLLGDQVRWDADHVVSNWATFYQSKNRVVLAEAAHSWWWFYDYPNDPDQLNVHVFDATQPGKSTYIGSGRVEGMLSDQFAIDEKDGAIRLATTTGMFWRWWEDGDERPTPENHIWVLEPDGDKYTAVGHVGIAKGERIMSARFMENEAYIVTFRNIDPLFTIDLRDNRDPKLVGELEVPGFSTYIHPLGEDNLLTIGVGGDQNGANWKTNVSIFNVGDLANPTLGSSLSIAADQGWSWSEALWEHKAFQYWAPKKLLAVPQSTWAYTGTGGYRYISRLELIEVDPTLGAGGLRQRGAIDHTPYYMLDPNKYWSYVDIRRSIFMGDYVYAISDKAISVHRTADLVKVADAVLPGYLEGDYWWWW